LSFTQATYTPESEQIAQLISGYIEIILKTKRDAGKIVSDKVYLPLALALALALTTLTLTPRPRLQRT
jgi:hypothetical protein